ncbi:MAG: flagellar protein FliS [Rhodothermaceae bacterium]|nr:flagellar protein FliS [Rhodothermaceae bacterium]
MHAASRMRQYQHQDVTSASPERLIVKLYDLGIAACYRGDQTQTRAVLVELMSSLDHEQGGDLAARLYALYVYCLHESADGELNAVAEILGGLREAWQEAVLSRAA